MIIEKKNSYTFYDGKVLNVTNSTANNTIFIIPPSPDSNITVKNETGSGSGILK